MQQSYFSIIIPTLNEENYITNILGDLKKQKIANFETIVVDASSNTKTREVCMAFSKDLSVKFYTVNKRSAAFQRNFGAQKAEGKYLVFIDADSRISPTFSKNLEKFILKKKGLIIIPYITADDNSPQAKITFMVINFLVELSHTMGKPFSTGGNMIWEKHFFHTLGGFDEGLYNAEDHSIVQKAYQWGVRVKFPSQLKVKFNLRRWRREGKLALLYKNIAAIGYILIKGDIRKKIFEYEMGGKVKKMTTTFPFSENFKGYFQQLKQFFNEDL